MPKKLMWFVCIGSIGFAIDAGVLMLLTSEAIWDPYLARMVSFAAAVSITWYLNRTCTFSERSTRKMTRELTFYFFVQVIGALINLGIYATLITVDAFFRAHIVVSLAIGAGVAMVFNYLGCHYIVFSHAPNFVLHISRLTRRMR